MKYAIRTTALGVIAVMLTVMTASHALAGSSGRHRMEGVIIGTGAAILGAAILAGSLHGPGRGVAPGPPECRRYGDRHDRYVSLERVWVSPVYEKRWVPGHVNPWGHWIPGHHTRVLIRDGYWEQRRIFKPY